jgi:coenzyme F420-dependent glucose-6-phosphate dehydrogenase
MSQIGFHASHELYGPSELLKLTESAYLAGFHTVSCSDHFHPWSIQGQSGYAWSWLGAALERVPLDFGTVCAPGQRYHPAIIAQAAATLAEMYPGRFWLALGTGQNLNEHITGHDWPAKEQRQRRLLECVDVIRRLWHGESVTTDGLVRVQDARLYTLPKQPLMIYGAAITDETAQWVGSWADGLLTVAKPAEALAKTVAAFHQGGGNGKPMRLQGAISFERSDVLAEIAAFRHWGMACLQVGDIQDVPLPEDFDRMVADHQPDEICERLRVSSDIGKHVEWIRNDFELGFEAVYLHYVGNNIRNFIDTFSRKVLPSFL